MKAVSVKQIEGNASKVTVTATEIRIKISQKLSEADAAQVRTFLERIGHATPDNQFTLRGKVPFDGTRGVPTSMTLWEGTGKKKHNPVVVSLEK